MGIETAVIIGAALQTASAVGSYNSTKSQVRAAGWQAARAAANRREEIEDLAARQRVSFLQAGVELEGTPQVILNDTYNKGIADINAIGSSYRQQSKNVMKVARAKLLSGLAGSAMTAVSGLSGSGLGGAASGVMESGGGFSSGSINGIYQGGNTL